MASVVNYSGQRLKITDHDGQLDYEPYGPVVEMPAVMFGNGEPWLAATVYLREKAFEAYAEGRSQVTAGLHATALAGYAKYLFEQGLDWNQFPEDRSLRPTYRYRGHVMGRVEARELARSTAANHMSVLRAFYSWARCNGYVDAGAEPFRTRQVAVRFYDDVGLQHIKEVATSDLTIRRTRVRRRGVEEGCTPLRMADRDSLLKIAEKHFRIEFVLLLHLGFFSGLRLGTILRLTHTALRKHFPSAEIPGWYSISVGTDYGIPTKGNVNYHPSMPEPLLRDILNYCRSVRRDTRVAAGRLIDKVPAKDLVFVSNRGTPLTTRSFSHDMTRLRTIANSQGLVIPRFHFHDTRATFGTAFVLASLQAGHKTNQIVPRLMRLMGHANAASSMNYVDFVEDDGRIEAAAADWEAFLGMPEVAE